MDTNQELLAFMCRVRPAVKDAHTRAYRAMVDLQLGRYPAHYEAILRHEEKLWGDVLDEIDAALPANAKLSGGGTPSA